MNNAPRMVLLSLAAGLAAVAGPLVAQERPSPSPPVATSGPTSGLTYADLVDLAEGTPLVIRAKIKQQAQVSPGRAPGLAPGFARLYIEADTLALLAGNVPIGESLRYLVDVPFDARGKLPKLKKQEVLLFARPVPGRPRTAARTHPPVLSSRTRSPRRSTLS